MNITGTRGARENFFQLKFTREEHSSMDAWVCAARGFRAGVFCGGLCMVRPVLGVTRRVHWGGACGRGGGVGGSAVPYVLYIATFYRYIPST